MPRKGILQEGESLVEPISPEFDDDVPMDGVADLDGTAAYLAVFDVGLASYRGIQHNRDPFSAIRATEKLFHYTSNPRPLIVRGFGVPIHPVRFKPFTRLRCTCPVWLPSSTLLNHEVRAGCRIPCSRGNTHILGCRGPSPRPAPRSLCRE
jgi:hypothetical protein